MLKNNKWTKEDLLLLYKERHDNGVDYKEIAKKINKSSDGLAAQYKRVDWDLFLENPDAYMQGKGGFRKWNNIEMAKLYAFIKTRKSYDFIAKELGRSYISVERKAQTTNWQAWQVAVGDVTSPEDIEESEDVEGTKQKLSDALVQLCRHDKDRLKEIEEDEFVRKTNIDKKALPVSFETVKTMASDYLDSLGFGNPEEVILKAGTYIVVGDSHGKHTKSPVFYLIKELANLIKADKIIHVGHILDDDNDISYDMGLFGDKLLVVAKSEELRMVQDQRNTNNFKYDIVRGGIQVGNDLNITNQELIGDYVKTSLSSLDSHIFDEKVIVNNHRLEWSQKCSEGEATSYIISPGALCIKHIGKTIKQIDFEDNRIVKQAFTEGFSKYRRMKHMYDYWDQGAIVIHVNAKGEHTIIPCLIRKLGKKEYATSYFDKIITNNGLRNPEKKIFVSADMHSPNQDNTALDIQEQICKDYKPDILVNIGDSHDYRALNHHDLDKGNVIKGNILDESAQVHYSLKRMANWAKEKYIIYGNHERFAEDFVAKFPQFGKYLDFQFICDLENLGYNMVDLKGVLKVGPTKFVHGDMTMYGQTGNKLEKAARTFKGTVFIGHMHYPAVRYGTYSVGLSGKLDQIYNEPNASTWIHGFGLCNHYRGFDFPTTIAINKNCNINAKTYKAVNPDSWKVKNYNVRLIYQGL